MVSLLNGLRQPVILLGAGFFSLLWSITPIARRGERYFRVPEKLPTILSTIELRSLIFDLVGLWLAVVLLGALIRYPYVLAASAAEGAPEPPSVEIGHFNLAMAPPYLLHASLLIALAWWLRVDLGLSGVMVAGIMAGVAPATIGLMGATGSLFSAINPLAIAQLVLTLGISYGAVMAITVGLYGLTALADHWLAIPLVSRFLLMYMLLAVFDLSGRVLHLHRRELPFAVSTYVDRREIADRVYEQHDWDEELDRIYRLVRQGELSSGLAAMGRLVAADGYRLEGYELLFERVRGWHLPDVMLAYSHTFIDRLVLVGQLQRAMEVTEACLRHDPGFRPAPDALAAIVDHARSVGHEQTAELLTMAIDRPPP
ncbi:MAG: hypothetical protein AAF184_24700 [Pseudomonadota bacterium]